MSTCDGNYRSAWCRKPQEFLVLLLSCIAMIPAHLHAQTGVTGAWPIAILEPPGAALERPILAGVAFSAETAIVAYSGTQTQGYRIHSATRGTNGWLTSQLLVEGTTVDGKTVAIDADARRIAVGLPDAAGGGRIDIHRREGNAWTFEQSIHPPPGVTSFGRALSMQGDLLAVSAVSSLGGAGLESYRRSTDSGQWAAAGFSVSGPFLSAEYFVDTDGERIAACVELTCRTFIDDGDGRWIVEASVAGGSTSVAVSGEWLFVGMAGGGVRIHRRSGSDWQPSATLPGIGPFAVNDSGLFVRDASSGRIAGFTVDGQGVWNEISSLALPLEELPSAPIACNESFALIGGQSFRPLAGAWLAAGVVGLPDLSNARFGASLGVAQNRLWIGSPGLSASDRAAGGVWVHARPGASLPSAGPVTPASPAISRGFGSAMSVDVLGNLAIASRTQTTVEPQEARVSLYTGSSPNPPPPANDFVMPLAQGRILDLDVAFDYDALALTWKRTLAAGRPHAEALVYNNRGNGFVSAQTIVLPDDGDWPDYGYGKRIVLYYDRMVAGVMRYERPSVTWDFEPAQRLPMPLAWIPRASGIAANDKWVVLPYSAELGLIARAYAWRASGGSYEQVDVYDNGFPVGDGCKVVAIDSNDAIACLATGDDGGPTIYRATRANTSSPWRVTAGGRVPGPGAGYASRFLLAMQGDEVYVGWPQTGPGIAGTDVGRVVVMTFNETILRNGFDAQ